MQDNSSLFVANLIIGFLFFLGCRNIDQRIKNQDLILEKNHIKFNQNITDSLSKYISNISDSCSILVKLDRSYLQQTFRFNVRPIKKMNIHENNLLVTQVNNRSLFISIGLEDLKPFDHNQKYIGCDGLIFVIYDSLGFIVVKENMNDFDDDFRPSQQLKFKF